ncbi:hypothetical protein BDR07DRAFT_1329782 [Suillus spraguei]|nr:hypothetical protein BDR07DRAFT_1329782 [Suillus spraguei]
MKSISITSMIVSVALMVDVATAYNPVGQPCDIPGGYGCSQDASINGGNAFIYECAWTNQFVYIAGCSCPTCCVVTTGGAYCT